jgi:cytochrome P450
MAPWAASHSKEVFGEAVHVFRPERWLENEEKNKFWEKIDVTFGSGYCVCLGKNIALMETYKAVVEVSIVIKAVLCGGSVLMSEM